MTKTLILLIILVPLITAVLLVGPAYDMELISLASMTSPSLQDIPVGYCDEISTLYCDFNKFIACLNKGTLPDTSTNNSLKESLDYWLYGTATEVNWFDRGCLVGWDYLKAGCNTACSTTWVAYSSYYAPCEQLVVAEYNSNYLLFSLGCLLIGCVTLLAEFYYNFAMLETVYRSIDLHLYNILCVFDYPGFMVDNRSVMRVSRDYVMMSEHFWRFSTDPVDGMLGLVHLASYTLLHESFFLQLHLLPPAWSVSSHINLTLDPGLYWPINYDHYHELFRIYIPAF